MDGLKGNLSGDRNGGIEGLPLQLMIVILVATMGTAVILGWMGNIETPSGISDVTTDTECIVYDGNVDNLCFKVYDQDKNPLEGATVLLTGLGVNMGGKTAYTTTDQNGEAVFKNVHMDFPGKKGFLNVSVTKPEYGEYDGMQILVINDGQPGDNKPAD